MHHTLAPGVSTLLTAGILRLAFAPTISPLNPLILSARAWTALTPSFCIWSQYITTPAVTLIFACPVCSAAMISCHCPSLVPCSPSIYSSLPPSLHPLTHPVCAEAWQCSRLPWPWFLLHRLLHTANVSLSVEASQAASQPTGRACRPSGDYEKDLPRSRFWLYNFPFRHLKSVVVKEPGTSWILSAASVYLQSPDCKLHEHLLNTTFAL